MQTYVDLSGSGLLYALVIAGLVFVAVLCVIFYRKTYKRALELGITKDTLSRINKNTISLTIVPSISIVIGLFTLSTVIGIPWSWFRLSVVGSVTYELMAAQMATASLGFEQMTDAMASDASTFGAVMIVMSVGIIAGIVTNTIIQGRTTVAVMATSVVISLLISLIVKKTGATWLANFTMAFTLILGMASALFWTGIFG